MKIVTIIIVIKIGSINEALITIHTNPVVRIKQKAISDITSFQRSVPRAPFSSEYFSNSFL